MKWSEYARKLESVNRQEVLSDMMIELSAEASEFVREQMKAGKTKKGTDILPEYTPMTKWIKEQKGQEWRHVTLQDTNSFQSKIFLKIKGDSFDFESDDWKNSMLVDKYGADIFGLTDESKAEFMRLYGKQVMVKILSRITGMPTI